jgi:hypothetical protein
MRKIAIGGLALAAALVLAGIGVWSSSKLLAKHAVGEFSAPVAKFGASAPGMISIYEIHRKANVRDLPVAHVSDLTFIFPSPGCFPATCVP